MNLKELREKSNMTRMDERMSVRDLSVDMDLLCDFVRDFGVKYFTKLGLDVYSEDMAGMSSSQYFTSKEIRFYIDVNGMDAGYFESRISCEKDNQGKPRYMDVHFTFTGRGIGLSSEIADDFEAQGNESLRKQFRKRMKKS